MCVNTYIYTSNVFQLISVFDIFGPSFIPRGDDVYIYVKCGIQNTS